MRQFLGLAIHEIYLQVLGASDTVGCGEVATSWGVPGFLEIRFKIRGRGNFGISPKFDQYKGPSAEICPLFMPSGLAYPRIFRNFIQNKGSKLRLLRVV